MKLISKKTRDLLLTAACLLGVPAIAFANVTGSASMFFKDSPVTLPSSASFVTVIQEPFSTAGTRMVFAKVVVTNSSATQRKADCRLDVIDVNVGSGSIVCADPGSVTLAPDTILPTDGTISMQCGQSATTSQLNHSFLARVSCRNLSGGTGVSASQSKITTVFQSNTNGQVVIQPGA